jgi:hypothetical protein
VASDLTASSWILQVVPKHGSGLNFLRPLDLQPRLLVHLLLKRNEGGAVLGLIDSFIASLHPLLRPADFKRTGTGVTRCFTNTRFAAVQLRAAGFLRFTTVERYKTWKLSLLGMMAAVYMLTEKTWQAKSDPNKLLFRLHQSVEEASRELGRYDTILHTLARVVRTEGETFESFGPFLRLASSQFGRYAALLHDRSPGSNAQLRPECLRIIDELEEDPACSRFMTQLCDCANINKMLEEAGCR